MTSMRFPRGFIVASFGAGVLVVAALGASVVLGQSGSRSRRGSGGAQSGANRPAARAPFSQKLWDYLQEVQYQNWAPLPGKSADAYPGEGPHGAFLKLYVNRDAAGSADDLPNGSLIVKENYGEDERTLMAITVMYRTKDYDPDHNDWYWIKYEPDGRVSEMADMPVAGKVRMCIECHQGAAGNDFVFAND